jgi:hypothetical protein
VNAHGWTTLWLSLAAGSVAYTGSTAQISAAPRVWLARHQGTNGLVRWVYQLVSCPYCLGTWLCLAATAIYRPLVVHLWWPLDYLVTATAMTVAAMTGVTVIKRALSH